MASEGMAVELNHTIVACPDKSADASWVAELLGLPEPRPYGPFMVLQLSNDLSRGCYFLGPGGHFLEILTRPYGSGG